MTVRCGSSKTRQAPAWALKSPGSWPKINARPKRAISAFLIQDENGQPLTQGALRSRFDKARTLAKVDFQFRDIRGKAATDTGNLAHAQKLLGHKKRDMTEHYVKARMGERVKPLR